MSGKAWYVHASVPNPMAGGHVTRGNTAFLTEKLKNKNTMIWGLLILTTRRAKI